MPTTREEQIADKILTVFEDIGITDTNTIERLLSMILVASSTKQRHVTLGKEWSGILPFDYVAGPLEPTHKVHIYGPPSAGKSALALNVANGLWKAEPQTKILLIDTTFTANKDYIQNLPAEFNIIQTTELYPVAQAAGEYNIIIIDDFACVTDPHSIINFMSICGITNTLLIICNQIRADMRGGYYAKRPGLVGMCTMSIYLKRVEKRDKYTYSQLKLERYRGRGTREGRAATLPMNYNGHILTEKVVEALLPLAKMHPKMSKLLDEPDQHIVKIWIKKLWEKD